MQQYQEIAYFLREFVRNDRQRSNNTQLDIRHESTCNQHAINKIVKSIAHQYHHAGTAMIMAMLMGMIMFSLLKPMHFTGFVMTMAP